MSRFREKMDFTGKNIVVSGGLGLIGTQVCDAFIEFNGNVIVADIDEKRFRKLRKERNWDNERCNFEHFDIADIASAGKRFQKIKKAFPVIDVWVNLSYPKTPDWGKEIEDVTFESWNENMKMHLGGYFWASKLVLEHMRKQGHGCLINFGSIYGLVGPNFDIYKGTGMTLPVAYSAIKGAIVNLSRYLADFYGPYNVRVNTICPGGVEDGQDRRFVRKYSELTPLKRMAKAEEIAMPTLFLASEGASYISGHTLLVDGGWTSW